MKIEVVIFKNKYDLVQVLREGLLREFASLVCSENPPVFSGDCNV